MIFIKAFYRKKTIKNYFLIFILTFFIIIALIFARQIYINKNNDYYKSSFIFLEAKNIEIPTIKNKNIKESFYALKDNYGEIFIIDNDLNNNEIILPSFFKKEYENKDNLFIEEYNIDLKIKEFQDKNNFYYINNETFEQLKKSDLTLVYIISLKNYIYKEKTMNELQDSFKENLIYFYDTNTNSVNYEDIIIVITTFLKICIVLFSIVFIITLINIIVDEQQTNKLYFVIGYNKFKIAIIFIIKVLSLVFIPLLLALIISLVFFTLLKTFK